MPIVVAKCPSCGANLAVDNNKISGNCPYCGANFLHEDAINIVNNNTTINNEYNIEQAIISNDKLTRKFFFFFCDAYKNAKILLDEKLIAKSDGLSQEGLVIDAGCHSLRYICEEIDAEPGDQPKESSVLNIASGTEDVYVIMSNLQCFQMADLDVFMSSKEIVYNNVLKKIDKHIDEIEKENDAIEKENDAIEKEEIAKKHKKHIIYITTIILCVIGFIMEMVGLLALGLTTPGIIVAGIGFGIMFLAIFVLFFGGLLMNLPKN